MSADPAINGLVLRGKIVQSAVNGRTLVQTSVLDEDARDAVELLHPFGYVASPVAGSDTLEIQVGGYASHKVHLAGDHTADALPDLQQGEAGLSRGGQQVIIRLTGVEIVTTLLKWGPTRSALKRMVQEEFMLLFNTHTHSDSGSGPPEQQMNATHLTGGS